MLSSSLEAVATALETAAGATTSANPNESGRWKRIAAAAETLADATTTANATLFGYMKRAAVALESIAGTDGTAENTNYYGYLKRIVDALEVQGEVGVGSWEHRLVLGAEGAVFEETVASWPALIGAEMMVNGDCSSATGWAFNAGGSIAVGKMQLVAYSDVAENDGITGTVIDGATYRSAFTIDTVSLGSIRWEFGNGLGTSRTAPGAYTEDIVAADTTGANLNATSATMQLDNFSVKSVSLLGVEADWAFSDTVFVFWTPGPPSAVSFDALGTQTASLTGTALTAFDAAVSNSTACSVTLTNSVGSPAQTISVAMKGGTAVNFTFTDTPGETVTQTVTSGAGSGFVLANVGAAAVAIVRVQIALA